MGRKAPFDSGGQVAFSVAVADVNGDGKPDVVVLNRCADSNCNTHATIGVLLGNGDGTLEPVVTFVLWTCLSRKNSPRVLRR